MIKIIRKDNKNMGEEDIVYTPTRDYGNGVENYECDGCRADGFTDFNCGVCPHNSERIREYHRKYVG